MVTGPIAVAYNAERRRQAHPHPGRHRQDLQRARSPRWNDPAIAKVNPGVTLPRHRDQGVLPLATSPARPRTSPSTCTPPRPPSGPPTRPRSGPARVRARRRPPASPARSRRPRAASPTSSGPTPRTTSLGIAQVDNGGGPVELTAESAGKAVATATQVGSGNDLKLSSWTTPPRRPGAYPIVLVTYEIVCSKGKDPAKVGAAQGLPEAVLLARSSRRPSRPSATPRCRPRWPGQGRRPPSTPSPDPGSSCTSCTWSSVTGASAVDAHRRDRRSGATSARLRRRPRLHRTARRPALRRRGDRRRPAGDRARHPDRGRSCCPRPSRRWRATTPTS